MSDVARSTEVAAADSKASVKPASKARRGLWSASRPMIDRYKWYEVAALYAGLFVFLFFVFRGAAALSVDGDRRSIEVGETERL